MTERIKLTVERARWLRGKDGGAKRLLSDDGRMCVLGFLAKESGATDDQILFRCFPSEIPVKWPHGLTFRFDDRPANTALARDIMAANDDARLSDAERELELSELLAEVGVDVEFVDGEAP